MFIKNLQKSGKMAKHHNSPESKIPTDNKIYEEHFFITQSSIDVLFHQMIKLHTQLRTQIFQIALYYLLCRVDLFH